MLFNSFFRSRLRSNAPCDMPHGHVEQEAIGKTRIPPAQCQHRHEQQRLNGAFYG